MRKELVDRQPDGGGELPARLLELAAAARQIQFGLGHLRLGAIDIRHRGEPGFAPPPRGVESGLDVLQ